MDPRRQARGARWRAADCGMTIRYGPVPATGGVVKRPEGACIPRGGSRGGSILIDGSCWSPCEQEV
ncbi:UNVERIFIED_ORG: hypothetical protein BDU10_9818 [Burkholderia sp. CF145]|jgi:hypothetical protein